MANVEQLAQQLDQLQEELQQQHQRMQQIKTENARLRADSLGPLPQLIQVKWREWSVKFERCVLAHGWASKRSTFQTRWRMLFGRL
eukprot:2507150-Amphidinium_carterae.1